MAALPTWLTKTDVVLAMSLCVMHSKTKHINLPRIVKTTYDQKKPLKEDTISAPLCSGASSRTHTIDGPFRA